MQGNPYTPQKVNSAQVKQIGQYSSDLCALELKKRYPTTNRGCAFELQWKIPLSELGGIGNGKFLESAEIEMFELHLALRLCRVLKKVQVQGGQSTRISDGMGCYIKSVFSPKTSLWERTVSYQFEFLQPPIEKAARPYPSSSSEKPRHHRRIVESCLSERRDVIGVPDLLLFEEIFGTRTQQSSATQAPSHYVWKKEDPRPVSRASSSSTAGAGETADGDENKMKGRQEVDDEDEDLPLEEEHVVLSICMNVHHPTHLYLSKMKEASLNAKQNFGVVGLKNHGATCYANVIFQMLFHNSFFRREIYRLNRQKQSGAISRTVVELQRVFASLEVNPQAVSTLSFMQAVNFDPGIQQDAHEFLNDFFLQRVLKRITDMYAIKVKYVTKCINVDYQSATEEKLFELSLSVSGCPTIQDALNAELAAEKLSFLYDTDDAGFGKQEATRQMQIVSLPPVLFIHAKRFDHFLRKIHAAQELMDELDIGGQRYILHTVVIHSGTGANAGHYTAFIKKRGDPSEFLLYDDESVTPVSRDDVFKHSIGTHWISPACSGYIMTYIQEVLYDQATNEFEPPSRDLLKAVDLLDADGLTDTAQKTGSGGDSGAARAPIKHERKIPTVGPPLNMELVKLLPPGFSSGFYRNQLSRPPQLLVDQLKLSTGSADNRTQVDMPIGAASGAAQLDNPLEQLVMLSHSHSSNSLLAFQKTGLLSPTHSTSRLTSTEYPSTPPLTVLLPPTMDGPPPSTGSVRETGSCQSTPLTATIQICSLRRLIYFETVAGGCTPDVFDFDLDRFNGGRPVSASDDFHESFLFSSPSKRTAAADVDFLGESSPQITGDKNGLNLTGFGSIVSKPKNDGIMLTINVPLDTTVRDLRREIALKLWEEESGDQEHVKEEEQDGGEEIEVDLSVSGQAPKKFDENLVDVTHLLLFTKRKNGTLRPSYPVYDKKVQSKLFGTPTQTPRDDSVDSASTPAQQKSGSPAQGIDLSSQFTVQKQVDVIRAELRDTTLPTGDDLVDRTLGDLLSLLPASNGRGGRKRVPPIRLFVHQEPPLAAPGKVISSGQTPLSFNNSSKPNSGAATPPSTSSHDDSLRPASSSGINPDATGGAFSELAVLRQDSVEPGFLNLQPPSEQASPLNSASRRISNVSLRVDQESVELSPLTQSISSFHTGGRSPALLNVASGTQQPGILGVPSLGGMSNNTGDKYSSAGSTPVPAFDAESPMSLGSTLPVVNEPPIVVTGPTALTIAAPHTGTPPSGLSAEDCNIHLSVLRGGALVSGEEVAVASNKKTVKKYCSAIHDYSLGCFLLVKVFTGTTVLTVGSVYARFGSTLNQLKDMLSRPDVGILHQFLAEELEVDQERLEDLPYCLEIYEEVRPERVDWLGDIHRPIEVLGLGSGDILICECADVFDSAPLKSQITDHSINGSNVLTLMPPLAPSITTLNNSAAYLYYAAANKPVRFTLMSPLPSIFRLNDGTAPLTVGYTITIMCNFLRDDFASIERKLKVKLLKHMKQWIKDAVRMLAAAIAESKRKALLEQAKLTESKPRGPPDAHGESMKTIRRGSRLGRRSSALSAAGSTSGSSATTVPKPGTTTPPPLDSSATTPVDSSIKPPAPGTSPPHKDDDPLETSACSSQYGAEGTTGPDSDLIPPHLAAAIPEALLEGGTDLFELRLWSAKEHKIPQPTGNAATTPVKQQVGERAKTPGSSLDSFIVAGAPLDPAKIHRRVINLVKRVETSASSGSKNSFKASNLALGTFMYPSALSVMLQYHNHTVKTEFSGNVKVKYHDPTKGLSVASSDEPPVLDSDSDENDNGGANATDTTEGGTKGQGGTTMDLIGENTKPPAERIKSINEDGQGDTITELDDEGKDQVPASPTIPKAEGASDNSSGGGLLGSTDLKNSFSLTMKASGPASLVADSEGGDSNSLIPADASVGIMQMQRQLFFDIVPNLNNQSINPVNTCKTQGGRKASTESEAFLNGSSTSNPSFNFSSTSGNFNNAHTEAEARHLLMHWFGDARVKALGRIQIDCIPHAEPIRLLIALGTQRLGFSQGRHQFCSELYRDLVLSKTNAATTSFDASSSFHPADRNQADQSLSLTPKLPSPGKWKAPSTILTPELLLSCMLLTIERSNGIEIMCTCYSHAIAAAGFKQSNLSSVAECLESNRAEGSLRLRLEISPVLMQFILSDDKHEQDLAVAEHKKLLQSYNKGIVPPISNHLTRAFLTARHALFVVSHVNLKDGVYFGVPVVVPQQPTLKLFLDEMVRTFGAQVETENWRFAMSSKPPKVEGESERECFADHTTELKDDDKYRSLLAAHHMNAIERAMTGRATVPGTSITGNASFAASRNHFSSLTSTTGSTVGSTRLTPVGGEADGGAADRFSNVAASFEALLSEWSAPMYITVLAYHRPPPSGGQQASPPPAAGGATGSPPPSEVGLVKSTQQASDSAQQQTA